MDGNLTNAAGVTGCVLTLYFIYCMLLARTVPPRRATAATSPRTLRNLATTPLRTTTTLPLRHFSSSRPISATPTMLQGALHTFEKQQKDTSSQTASVPLPPVSPSRMLNSSVNTIFKSPFHQNSSSSPNGLSGSQQKAQRAAGFKRTSSGLAKPFGASFDDDFGSVSRPITLDDRSPGKNKVVQVSANEFVDENDFDSDVDLDVEEPSVPKAASAQLSKFKSPFRPIVYPTLPRQQQAQSDAARYINSEHESAGLRDFEATQGSSAPIPWSSSPVEHLQPASITSFARFKHVPKQAASLTSPARPVKRRTLPWAGTQHTQESSVQREDSKSKSQFLSTPRESKSSLLWNTSASAVKEQQKQHREQTKRATAVVKAQEAAEEIYAKAKSSRERPAKVFLSEEQQHVLNLVVDQRKSVFFTGSAGTGKSVLMREIISNLRRKYAREPDRVAVTASTGLAACNVGGVTLHSFAGIGLGKEDVPTLVRKIKKNQKARHRWMRTKVLIVDEVSMVDGDLFDKLEAIARQIRANGRPFGGIQLVITGDFFQLPPVPDSGRVAKFAFDAATWSTSVEHTIGLHHVFRQKDPVFASMLNEMREGRMSQASISAFQKLTRPLQFEDQLECTELYPRREDVERANFERLHSLQGQSYIFDSRDGGAINDKAQRDKLLSNCMAPESITLKKGAQVMLIKNVDESLVNGSIGQVMGLMDEQQFDRYTTEEAEAVNGGSGESGLQGKKHIESVTTSRRWPVVRFLLQDGTTRDLLCQPETWKVEQPNGEVQASRLQVPLILAWALSIHKAQGQTLDRVKVDLGKVFEKGQAYVALSRATSMAGLQVLRFDPKKVVAHDRVRHFYANLSRIELDAVKTKTVPAKPKGGINADEYEKMFVEDEWKEDF